MPNTSLTWHLVALTPELGDISFPVDVSMSVGRQDSNNVVLATPQISRQHAKFNQVGKSLFLQDLGSSNGTFVNGERIGTQAVEVQPNDEIAFADLVFVVSQDEATQSALDETLTAETLSSAGVEASNSSTATESTPDTSTETVYKISDSEKATTTETIGETANTSAPTKETIITDEKVTTASPITVTDDKPIASTASVTPETVSKKSPMLWIIAIIIILIIAGVILKGI